MRKLYLIWNYMWFNYHYSHLRKHDHRLEVVLPDWMNRTSLED